MIGGMVASPTPTVPISVDSINVIVQPDPGNARANMLAAIQPAVPPPTIAILRIRSGERLADDAVACMIEGQKNFALLYAE